VEVVGDDDAGEPAPAERPRPAGFEVDRSDLDVPPAGKVGKRANVPVGRHDRMAV